MGGIGAVRRSLETRQEQERLVQCILLGQIQHGTIQSDEYWNLHQRRDAPGERIDIVTLIYLCDFLIHYFRIRLIFGL